MKDLILQRVDKARALLLQARNAPDAKKVADMAHAAAVYAKRQRLSQETIDYAVSVRVDARVLMGDFLRHAEKNVGVKMHGGTKGKTGGYKVEPPAIPTLNELGITKRESSECQRLLRVKQEAPEIFEQIRNNETPERRGFAALKKQERFASRAERSKEARQDGLVTDLSELVKAGRKFRCIYADPPWAYDNQATRAATHRHYETLTVYELCELPVRDLVEEECHLHLWTTNVFLFDCPRIFEAWGFDFKSSFVWVKPQMGIGNYWRNSHEILLLGVRGGMTAISQSEHSWIESPRTRHSQKPESVREAVMRLSPGRYLELFGRRAVDGWTVFGNEVAGP